MPGPFDGAPPGGNGFDWQALIPLLALGLSGAIGGKAGLTGAAQGLGHGFQAQQRMGLEQQQFAAQEQYRQEQLAIRQQQMAAAQAQADADRKQQAVLRAGQVLPAMTTQKEYDVAVNELATTAGMRPAALMALFPFRPPSTGKATATVLEKFFKNPANKDALSQPGWDKGVIQVELEKGKPPVTMTIPEAMKHAGADFPVLMDPETGSPILAPKGTDPDKLGTDWQEIAKESIAAFTAQHGRPPKPGDERKALIEAAITRADALKRDPKAGADPVLQEIRALRLEQMKKGINTELSPGQERIAASLLDDFRNDSKDFRVREAQFTTLQSAGQDQTPASDLSMIFAYMKMLDPTSVVREGEQASAANARAVPDGIRNIYNRVLEGHRLTPRQRQDFLSQGQRIYSGALRQHKRTLATYTDRATRRGIPPEFVVIEPDPTLTETAPTPGGPVAPAAHQNTPYRVGDIVTVNGKRVKVTKLLPDGKYEGVIVR